MPPIDTSSLANVPRELIVSAVTDSAAAGRVALVTGASSGIGAATARVLAERGMRVVVNYLRSREAAEAGAADIRAAGGHAMAIQADVREAAAVAAMIERVAAAWGGVDVLVGNALTPYAIKPFEDMTWDLGLLIQVRLADGPSVWIDFRKKPYRFLAESEEAASHVLTVDSAGRQVNRLGYSRGYSAAEYYLLPIDECYKLVGLIRMHWKGLSGGTEVWKALGEFFTDVKARSVEVSVEVKEASQIEEESHA